MTGWRLTSAMPAIMRSLSLAVRRERIGSSCCYRLGTEGMAQVAIASEQGNATIGSPILSVRHAAKAWAGLGWVGELGRCHKNKPQAVYSCLGFGGVVATRLLTGQQGASGDGGCCPVGQCAFDEDFLLGKQLHLGMRRSVRLPAAGIEPILRRSISLAEPLWCLIRALTMRTGKGVSGRPRETLLVALLGEPR